MKPLYLLRGKTPRRSLLVLFSDLLEDQDAVVRALNKFTSHGGEAIVFHVLHEEELHLPDLAEAVFIDSETGRQVRVNVPEVRQAYRERINEYTNKWRGSLTACGVDYQLVSTQTHYHEAIGDYLFTRAGRG